MRKIILMMLLAVVSNSAMADAWIHNKSKDEMSGEERTYIYNNSLNTVNFNFPYEGVQRGRLHVFSVNQFAFTIEKGQIVCQGGSEYGTCSVFVKFDDGDTKFIKAKTPGYESDSIIFTDPDFFNNLKTSKKIKIQPYVFQNGFPVFIFDVEGVCEQTHRNDTKECAIW